MGAENIIIYRIGSLGDTVVALPCFHKIAERFPAANRIVLTNFPVSSKAAPLEAILGGSGLVSRSISYPVGTRSIIDLWRLSREIRALKVTTLIYLMPNRGWIRPARDFVFFRLCGLRRIIGFPITSDLRNLRIDKATGLRERECERLARTIAELGRIDLAAPGAWDLLLTEREKSVGRAITSEFGATRIIAINMGGKAVENDWGADRWKTLLGVLAPSHGSFGLVAVGGAEDSARAAEATRNWPNRVVNACGSLTPRESAAVLREASAFIGHDSGPLHLAAASGVRCVGLFGSKNPPRQWHPMGDFHQIIHRMEGIGAIGVDDVAKAVSAILPVTAALPSAGESCAVR